MHSTKPFTGNDDDSRLLNQLKEGNATAFDGIYQKYWKNVYNQAYKRLRNDDLAKDVAQEVFIQLWERKDDSPILQLKPYLYVMTRNSVFRLMERMGRLKMIEMEEAPKHVEDTSHADELLYLHELQSYIETLIKELPEKQQLIFRMRYFDHLSSLEIAEKLNISPKTVRNTIGKVLTKLKEQLFILKILLFFC